MKGSETQRRVTITQGFWIAETEVTQGQWKSVMKGNPSQFKGDKRPVETITWGEVITFCSQLTEQLKNSGKLSPPRPAVQFWAFSEPGR